MGSLQPLRRNVSARVELSDTAFSQVEALAQTRTLRKHEYFLHEGEVCRHVAFLNRGCVRFVVPSDGQEMTGHIFLEESWLTDYHSYLTESESRIAIQAIEPSELVVFSRDAMNSLYETVPGWEKLGRLIAEEIFLCAHERSMSLLAETPENRYQRLQAERPDLFSRLPQHIIASYIGVAPETLSRMKRRSETRPMAIGHDVLSRKRKR